MFAQIAYAQCPLCIITVGGGMFIAQKLGVDDLLVSIWISALNVAISFWLASKFQNKFLKNGYFITAVLLASTLIYFQISGQMGHPGNRFFGIDKILFGQLLGTVVMILSNYYYQSVKQKLGRVPFPYAKVVFPFGSVLAITLIFKLLFRL
jgi:uncharacterized membrane protein